MKPHPEIQALLLAVFIQLCIAALVFFGFILDPLIGFWIVGIYFFIINFYLVYRYLLGLGSTLRPMH